MMVMVMNVDGDALIILTVGICKVNYWWIEDEYIWTRISIVCSAVRPTQHCLFCLRGRQTKLTDGNDCVLQVAYKRRRRRPHLSELCNQTTQSGIPDTRCLVTNLLISPRHSSHRQYLPQQQQQQQQQIDNSSDLYWHLTLTMTCNNKPPMFTKHRRETSCYYYSCYYYYYNMGDFKFLS